MMIAHDTTKKNDGLTRTQRYRLKDLDAYRKHKNEYGKQPVERAKKTAYMQKWREKNREKSNKSARDSYHRHRDRIRAQLKADRPLRIYGLTSEQFEALKELQGGCCAICHRVPEKDLHIDHDHESGQVRGLLCVSCNTRLGWIETYGISKIISYLDTETDVIW